MNMEHLDAHLYNLSLKSPFAMQGMDLSQRSRLDNPRPQSRLVVFDSLHPVNTPCPDAGRVLNWKCNNGK